jgi:hypothetical protein
MRHYPNSPEMQKEECRMQKRSRLSRSSFFILASAFLCSLRSQAAPVALPIQSYTNPVPVGTATNFFSHNAAAISNAISLGGYLKNADGSGNGITLANSTLSGDTLLSIGSTNRLLALDDNGYLVSVAVTRTEGGHLSGLTANVQDQLNAKSAWLALPTNYFTVTSSTNVALKAHGISSLVNVTAGDLQDLASMGVFDSAYPSRVRVLRDDNGYILGSGRWFNKDATDARISDGITIILPIDVPSDASPGRWVLEGYEQ